MKTILAAVALATATLTAPAFAENFGVSVGMGDNGYYGHIDIGNAPQPVVYNTQPVIIQQQPVYIEPAYMRVPMAHQHNWRHHCGAYNACGRPVYFVKDNWDQHTYRPHYAREHARDRDHRHHNRNDNRHFDRNENRHFDRNDHRGHDNRRDHDRNDRFDDRRHG